MSTEQTVAKERTVVGLEDDLIRLWNVYAERYKDIYGSRIQSEHIAKLGKLLRPTGNGVFLDAGCGAGNTFELIIQGTQPTELHAIDWSEEMLSEAKLEAEGIQQTSDTIFEFYCGDISNALPWPNDFFDGVMSNLVICYLPCGWRKAVKELARVTKPGGHLYIGTLLEKWTFKWVILRHGPIEFLLHPIASFRELKYLKQQAILAKIIDEAKRRGAEFPSPEQLTDALENLGFGEIKVTPTHWGRGLVLRARKLPTPFMA